MIGRGMDLPREHDPVAPREVVREVAASLKSLAKVLPYPEYAAIVHRIAELRWRCETGGSTETLNARPTAQDFE